MTQSFPSSIGESHQDYPLLSRIRNAILNAAGGQEKLRRDLPSLLQDAIDFVIDPIRTARNTISQLDQVEKTFIGLKVEHVLRDYLDVPRGNRDLVLDGIDVDVKNTVSASWMIPPETFGTEEPCLLVAIADAQRQFWLGLIVARSSYLGAGAGNRDRKRSIVKAGRESILWLISAEKLPPSRWTGIDMDRFLELRRIKGGTKRAAAFFRENLGKKINRRIVEALLHDQRDYMKRLRGNGGARDLLRRERIALHSGIFKSVRQDSMELAADEWMAIKQP